MEMLYSLIVCHTLITDALTIAFHLSTGLLLKYYITFLICNFFLKLSNNLGTIIRLGKTVNKLGFY